MSNDFVTDGVDVDETQLAYLGPCCMCETERGVRNIIGLEQKAPMPGRGWGCAQCDLPADGATAVLCDECLKRYQLGAKLLHACRGYPRQDGRVSIDELEGEHEHDMSKHPECTEAQTR